MLLCHFVSYDFRMLILIFHLFSAKSWYARCYCDDNRGTYLNTMFEYKAASTYTPYILMWIRTWIPETTHMRVQRTLHPRYWRDRGKQWGWGKNIVWTLRGA